MSILVPAGKVGRLFGLDGGVVIGLYDNFSTADIDAFSDKTEPLFVKLDGLAVPLFIEGFERRGQRGALVRFADIDTPGRAAELVGEELFVQGTGSGKGSGLGRGEGRPDGDELFYEDLVGYGATVTEEDGQSLQGVVTGFVDSEMNPLLQVEVDGREVLIPAVDKFIDRIDTKKRHISFVVPEGFLELYM